MDKQMQPIKSWQDMHALRCSDSYHCEYWDCRQDQSKYTSDLEWVFMAT